MKAKAQQINDSLVLVKTIFTSLGVALSNIDDAPIKLNGIRLDNCLDTVNGITAKLTSHYKQAAITEIFKVLGSLNIIGNPVGLFSNVATGMQDLFEKPIEGFV